LSTPIHDGLLQTLRQARTDDVVDFLGRKPCHDRFVIKAAIGSQQAHTGLPQVVQGGLDETLEVITRCGVARAQPEVGHQAPVGHKRHQRVVACPAFVFGVVALGCTFHLAAPARQDRGVHIQGDGVQAQGVEQPAVAAGLHPGGNRLVKALEQPDDGFVACGFAPAKQAHQGGVQSGDVGMCKTGSTTPDADHQLLDELFWKVAPIGAWWWQIPPSHGFFEAHAVEHAFE
jgi:hypothetical protein